MITITELMTKKEEKKAVKRSMEILKNPGKQAVTHSKSKQKEGESVTVSEGEISKYRKKKKKGG